jgi:rRNA maturation endonuclease Nob1
MPKKDPLTYTCYICDTEKPPKEPCPKCGSCLTRVGLKKTELIDKRRTFVLDERQHGGGI